MWASRTPPSLRSSCMRPVSRLVSTANWTREFGRFRRDSARESETLGWRATLHWLQQSSRDLLDMAWRREISLNSDENSTSFPYILPVCLRSANNKRPPLRHV